MDAADINPERSLPQPYFKDQERILVPKLNLTPTSSDRKIRTNNVCPDPALDVTPLKHNHARRHYVEKCNNKNKPRVSKRKENFRVESVNPWCSSITNRTHWIGFDHLRGEKVEKSFKPGADNTILTNRRRPTFYDSLRAKSDKAEVDSKLLQIPITITEAEKFQKPEFNSCLKLAQEIKQLKIVKKSVDNEIAKQMKTEKMRQEVSEKASAQVNIPFSEQQFKNLISINASTCEVVMKLQEEKEMKMKSCKPQPRPRDPEPDIMDFYSDSIYHEHCTIHLEIPRLDLNTPELSPRDWTLRYYQQLLDRNEPL